jgi:hypothetical protein
MNNGPHPAIGDHTTTLELGIRVRMAATTADAVNARHHDHQAPVQY